MRDFVFGFHVCVARLLELQQRHDLTKRCKSHCSSRHFRHSSKNQHMSSALRSERLGIMGAAHMRAQNVTPQSVHLQTGASLNVLGDIRALD